MPGKSLVPIVVAVVAASAAVILVVRQYETPSRMRHAAAPASLIENVDARAHTDAGAPAPVSAAREPAPTPEELDRQLQLSPPDARDRVLAALLPSMMAADPQAVARYAELQTDAPLRELLLRQVAQLWGNLAADDAAAWAESLPDADERDAAITDVALGLALTNPARAVELRERLGQGDAPDPALEGLAQQWASQDFHAALAWTEAQPAGVQRDRLMQRLLYVRAENGAPADAARIAAESLVGGKMKEETIATLARQWWSQDPAATGAWIQTLDARSAARARAEIPASGAP